MERRRSTLTIRHMRSLIGVGAVGGLSDTELLRQFSTGDREAAEAAFATLVERHGPMVLRVCQGALGDSQDVDDAFQATFLVLVRKADSLWVRDSLGPWMHGVALRVATKAKVTAARRKTHERRGAELAGTLRESRAHDGLSEALHDEIERLPGKYRAPIVLCYLEGLTHEGAAAALGWPVGTVRGRLARARDSLRSSLGRRGLAPSAEAFAVILSPGEASAVPLSGPMVQAVMSLVAERSAGVAPAAVAALAKGALRVMTMAKLKTASILVLLGLVAIGLATEARSRLSGGNQAVAAEPAPPAKVAAEPAKGEPQTWPAGVEVRGRVVDHRGAAVAGADVLLLGGETLTVYADPGPREGTVRYSISTRPAEPPPTVKTDGRGRFSLRRPTSPADRIAVVSETMLLWEVTRKDVPDAKEIVITLPEPGELRIRAEIPEKPGKQEYWIVGRPTHRLDWESDSLFYRGIQVPNPGERVVRPLPPAQYAVERINFTQQGVRSNLMTQCERRLLSVESGKRTDAAYDRKTGRRVEGRVRGLEKVKLRYAMVTIGFWGPEEQFTRNRKPSKMMTHFDVIPITSDGRFTTPPLPPNQYEFQVAGMLASAPQGQQGYDFDGSATVTIPEKGEVPPVEIVVKPKEARAEASDPKKPRLEIHARDESGSPIKDFEAQLYGPPNASPEAAIGTAGLAVMAGDELKSWNHGDLIVCAPGFASTIEKAGPIEGLRKVDVTLKRGTKVRLRVRDSAGKPIAPGVMPLPQVYLPRYRRDAWFSFALTDTAMQAQTVAATNFLNVRREEGGDFVFHVRTDEPTPVYFGFSHPDVLLYHEKGPMPASDLAGGVWDVVLPRPATLEISLKSPLDSDGKSLFGAGYYGLSPILSGQVDGAPGLNSGELSGPEWRKKIQRLAPGAYSVSMKTRPREATTQPPDGQARPGIYYDLRKIDVKAGEQAVVAFEPPPFKADAWRGKCSATLVVKPAGDQPLGIAKYRVSYTLLNYGGLPVTEGTLGPDGRIVLENLAPSGKDRYDGQYSVTVGDEHLGTFNVKDQSERQEFSFRMPLRAGDLASGEALDLETGQPVRIADFRGRLVFLEFWATWCGPCREPMQRLVELAKRRGESWKDNVAFVAISIDNDREVLRRHVRQNGLSTIRQLWSPQDQAEKAGSAYGDYSISGVPTSFLIGRDGRIVWRGHPASLELERKLEELIAHDR